MGARNSLAAACVLIALAIGVWGAVHWFPSPRQYSTSDVRQSLQQFAAPASGSSRPNRNDVDAIWRIADERPGEFHHNVLAWLNLLLKERQYEDCAALAELGILDRPYDVWNVASAQRARVVALLGDQRYAQALAEAKSYYNVATLTQTSDAAALLAKALAQVAGQSAANAWAAEQGERAKSPRSVFASIKVDAAPYDAAIAERTADTSATYRFSDLMALGDMQLLADHAAKARSCFEQACQWTGGKQNNLSSALEGIARSIRAADGSRANAVEFITDARDNPSMMAGQIPAQLTAGQIRSAAAAVGVDNSFWPPSDNPQARAEARAELAASAPAPAAARSFRLPAKDAFLLARLAPQSDPDLRNWLNQWRLQYASSQPVTVQERDQLSQIIQRAALPPPTLRQIAEDFYDISGDTRTIAATLAQLCPEADPGLRAWLQNSGDSLAAGQPLSDVQRKNVANVLQHSSIGCVPLSQVAGLFRNLSHDPAATAVFSAAVIRRGDHELSGYAHFSNSMRPILLAMKNCESSLWAVDEAGDSQYVDTLYLVSKDLDRWVPAKDAALGWTRAWARIGIAEYHAARQENQQALDVLFAMDVNSLTEGQRIGVAWAKAVVYLQTPSRADAIPELQLTAAHEGQHRGDACGCLVDVLCQEGRYDEALADAAKMETQALKRDSRYSNDEIAQIHCAKGYALYCMGRYSDAIAELRLGVIDPDIQQSKGAWSLLARSYAKLGDMSDANSAFDEWVRRGRPNLEEAAAAFNEMGLSP